VRGEGEGRGVARLTIEAGEGTPLVHELVAGAPVTLGRHRSNTIVVHDEHASRFHAEIVHSDGRWLINNVGAPLNGTRIDGERIAGPTPLEDDQEIGIGDTRLRFRVGPEKATAIRETVRLPQSAGGASTVLLADELTALCAFMTASVDESDPRLLIGWALDTALRQTQASFAGFLSLDPEAPLPKLTVPEQAPVDFGLSRQLTRKVQQEGKPVWLAGTRSDAHQSDSLVPFTDALCFPLHAGGAALEALHVYKVNGLFTERNQRFCEVLAGYLAKGLHVLRVRRTLEAENSRLRGRAATADQLLGDSAAMQQLRQRIARAAARPVTVLIQGESGVGKELVALALHRESPRRDGPLVVVNCAAIAATLPEAELFGHCKGAFTGADHDRPGLFQQADEGTLFLDEVGELPLDCQAKLLRVIEGKGFRPVGATGEIRPDVRILAATNRDLEKEVREGRFRHDLYFRLQVIHIPVPPLREHAADIPLLVAYYLDRLAVECRRQVKLADAALKRLQTYSWPGNVRQLWAVLESAVTMSDSTLLDAADLPLPAEAPAAQASTLQLEELETWAIRQALRQTRGNVTQAAKLLGVVRDTLASKMKKKGIDRENVG
jgi:two-component system, NtrC family, response regulator HydG